MKSFFKLETLTHPKNVEIDVDTRQNSTYLVLKSTLQVREGSEHLAELILNNRCYLKRNGREGK